MNINWKYMIGWGLSLIILGTADYLAVEYGYIIPRSFERNGTCIIDKMTRLTPCNQQCELGITLSLLNVSNNNSKIITRFYGQWVVTDNFIRGDYNVGKIKTCYYDSRDPNYTLLFLEHLQLGMLGIILAIFISLLIFINLIACCSYIVIMLGRRTPDVDEASEPLIRN